MVDRAGLPAPDSIEWAEGSASLWRLRCETAPSTLRLAVAREGADLVGLCVLEENVVGLPVSSCETPNLHTLFISLACTPPGGDAGSWDNF